MLQYLFSDAIDLIESCCEDKPLEDSSSLQDYPYILDSCYKILKQEEYYSRGMDLMIDFLNQHISSGKLSVPSPLVFRFYSDKESR